MTIPTPRPSSPNAQSGTGEARPRASRTAMNVVSLEALVGAHPESLRALFAKAPPADPTELGDEPTGRLLGLAALAPVHLATRAAVGALSRVPLWTGVGFDHGGNAGYNRVLGGRALRFRAAVEASELDGLPALVLRYGKSPWPFSSLRDELRSVGPGIALGAFLLRSGDRHDLIGWFGLHRCHSGG